MELFVAPEAFFDVKGSELIFSTRAVMIPVSRNYVCVCGGGSNFSKKTKREFHASIIQGRLDLHLQGDLWDYAELIMMATIFYPLLCPRHP